MATAQENNSIAATQIAAQILKGVRLELKKQKHQATGRGIKTLETKVNVSPNSVLISILGEDYLKYQDSGLKPGARSKGDGGWIDALTKWVQVKGIESDIKKAKSIAFAIAKTQIDVGMHTKNKRLDLSKRGFIEKGIREPLEVINEKMFEAFNKTFETVADRFARDIKTSR